METRSLTWRALTTGDTPALTRAFAAVEATDHTEEHYSEQDVREALEEESLDLGRDSLAAFDRDGEVVAFAWVTGTAEVRDVDRIYAAGAVLPAARRRGLGRRLQDWAEERAAGLHRERHPGVPGEVCVDVHEHNPGKEALVRAAGYTAIRRWHRMTRALDGPLPDAPEAPAGLALMPYAAKWDEAVRLAHTEAFADSWGAAPPDEQRWARWYTGGESFRPDVSWLVLDGDVVAAYVLTHCWDADTAATGVREAFVGQFGVRPRLRGRGLGSLLLAAALQSYRAAGYDRTTLTVDTGNTTGALGLYERAGYVVNDASIVWSKALV